MNVLVRLDASLFVLGLLALLPESWGWLRRRRTVRPRKHWLGVRAATMLCFFFGLSSLIAAGLDVGLAAWNQACHPSSDDNIEESMIAPDFSLPALDENRSIRLSDYRGHKPVVLIFGSFGCEVFCSQVVHLPELHDKYGDSAQFVFVYVREPEAGRATRNHDLPEELREFAEPPSAPPGSRLRLVPRVRAGKKHFGLHFPCLLDNENGEVGQLYEACPKRLIIVDKSGHIALDSGKVPKAPFPWKKITEWLDRNSEFSPPHYTERRS